MRLMKYSFICPICDKSYYTYVEQRHYQEMFNNNLSIEDNFKGYPEYYQKMIQTSICPVCQHKENKICLTEDNNDDTMIYDYIQELEQDARKAI